MGNEYPFIPWDPDGPVERLAAEIFSKIKAQAQQESRLTKISYDRGPLSTPDTAKTILRRRRQRDQIFADDLFGEPIWDMLLDLFAHSATRKRVSVSSLCLAAAVPPTTALRHMKVMENQGMIIRHADPLDSRRVFVELSPDYFIKMDSMLSSWMSRDEIAV
jgi:DNA-binding transcriptional ArsR family regulator